MAGFLFVGSFELQVDGGTQIIAWMIQVPTWPPGSCPEHAEYTFTH